MKKIFISILLISLIMLNTITSYAETVAYEVPITLTASTKDAEGKEQKNFQQRDNMSLEYMITPQDISLGSISNNKPIDIVLVLDTSGSMNYVDGYNYYDPSRLENSKEAMKSFIDKMSKAKNADLISVSIVTFDYSAETVMEFKNVSKDYDDIIEIINSITAEGSTNGGDGLRIAYKNLSTNRPIEAEKYVLYLADGENNVLTYINQIETKYVYRHGNRYTYLDKYYGDSLKDFEYNSFDFMYGYKYVHKTDNSVLYTGLKYYGKNLINHKYDKKKNYDGYAYYLGKEQYISNYNSNGLHITDQFYNYGSLGSLNPLDYAKTVANLLLSQNDVTTYVIGVGDNKNIDQKYQNTEICKSANNTNFIKDYYSAVDDTEKLDELYNSIGDKILETVLVKDVQLKIDFPVDIQYKGTEKNLLNILDITIDNASVIDTSKIIVNDNSIFISIDDFEYTYNPIDKAYKANPINLNVKMNIPENCPVGKVDMFSTNLSYKALGLNLNITAPEISFNIVEGIKPVSISSSLEIFKDGSARLSIIPSEKLSTLNIKTTADTTDIFKQYINLEKDNEYILELTSEQLNAFLEGKIYLETINKVDGKDIIGLDEVSIIKFSEIINEKINSVSDTHRLSLLQILGEQNLSDFNFIVNGKNVDNIAPIYLNGIHSKELELLHGKNEIIISPKNSFGHITKLHFDVDVCAKRPRLSSMNISQEKIDIIISNDSCNLKSVVVKLYDKDGNFIKTYEELNINSSVNPNKKQFSFNLNELDISQYNLEVEIIDVHNNALLLNDSDSTILENGIYLRTKKDFYNGGIVANYRYQFAIKFIVSKPVDLLLDIEAVLADGFTLESREVISIDLKNCKLYLVENDKLINSINQFDIDQNKQRAIYKINNIEFGKEYLLVFDLKINSSSNKIKSIILNAKMGNVNKSINVPIEAAPNLD